MERSAVAHRIAKYRAKWENDPVRNEKHSQEEKERRASSTESIS